MTEQEWLASSNPTGMLNFLYQLRRTSERKLRLFLCSCCRHMAHALSEDALKAMATCELFADGLASSQQLEEAARGITTLYRASPADAVRFVAHARRLDATEVHELLRWISFAVQGGLFTAESWLHGRIDKAHASLLRDVFFYPLRTVALDPTWLTPPVQKLAQAAYQDRDFGVLPILADALEEAGCTDADILNHCRGPGPHVRGCWVVDLILSKDR
jgi:hypothetical protein